MTRPQYSDYRKLTPRMRQHVEVVAAYLSARIGKAHKLADIQRELEPVSAMALNKTYISNAANVLRRVFGWAILTNKHGIRLVCRPAPLIWPDDLDGRSRYLEGLTPEDRDLVERLEAAAVEVHGERLIRACVAARIIGCAAGMQTTWINNGRITPSRARVTPSQRNPSGWVTGWPLAQAINCGLSHHRMSRPWTEEDEDQLMEMLGTRPIEEVAELLDRSVCAVRERYRQLGVTETDAQGLMTVGVAASLCGVAPVTVRKWCTDRVPRLHHTRLPSRRRNYMISIDALGAFFRRHPDKFDRLSMSAQRRIERAGQSAGARRQAVMQ